MKKVVGSYWNVLSTAHGFERVQDLQREEFGIYGL